MHRMLQAVTDKGESGVVKKPKQPVHIYKCLDCSHERKAFDLWSPPQFCAYCGSINIGFDRSE